MAAGPVGGVVIGTSGWAYPAWRGPFYPEELPAERWLAYYAAQFPSVEINDTFYRMPEPETVAAWAREAPAGFEFAVKASRFVTHMKKLKDARAVVPRFLDALAPLGAALGPVLFQLPQRWKLNLARLDEFLDALPEGPRYALELREPSWWQDAVLQRLERRNVAFCAFDLAGQVSPRAVTSDFVYVRLHGPVGGARARGEGDGLACWAEQLRDWAREGRQAYCYFDNDQCGYAVRDALAISRLLGGAGDTGAIAQAFPAGGATAAGPPAASFAAASIPASASTH